MSFSKSQLFLLYGPQRNSDIGSAVGICHSITALQLQTFDRFVNPANSPKSVIDVQKQLVLEADRQNTESTIA